MHPTRSDWQTVLYSQLAAAATSRPVRRASQTGRTGQTSGLSGKASRVWRAKERIAFSGLGQMTLSWDAQCEDHLHADDTVGRTRLG